MPATFDLSWFSSWGAMATTMWPCSASPDCIAAMTAAWSMVCGLAGPRASSSWYLAAASSAAGVVMPEAQSVPGLSIHSAP